MNNNLFTIKEEYENHSPKKLLKCLFLVEGMSTMQSNVSCSEMMNVNVQRNEDIDTPFKLHYPTS